MEGALSSVSSSRSSRVKRTVSAAPSSNSAAAAAAKPKQSKSRNGCSTCKAKRLKCDEAKPTCRQCHRRNVVCGGYKKDFKWRSFGKSSFSDKFAVTDGSGDSLDGIADQRAKGLASCDISSKPKNDTCPTTPAAASDELLTPPAEPVPSIEESGGSPAEPGAAAHSPAFSHKSSTPTVVETEEADHWIVTPDETVWSCAESTDAVSGALLETALNDDAIFDTPPFFSPSTQLCDLSPTMQSPSMKAEYEEVEEIARHTPGGQISQRGRAAGHLILGSTIQHGPLFPAGSPEMLLMRYDRHTCGILSVKDGMTENPWRTLVWPLAADSPALYHAICALAAFHCSQMEPALKVRGLDHMRRSVRTLARDIRDMRPDAALATTLTLAFAEVWDRKVKTGIEHLRGAKALVSRAVAFQQRTPLRRVDVARLQFLYNAWTYTSVLARLTSTQDISDDDEPSLSIPTGPSARIHEIDPLLGCAASLFPLISRLASVIRKVRATTANSISVISKAIDLKTLLEQWEPPAYFEPPEDPTSNVQHCIQTAHAYRWAALLHLHQAVPEIPSESATDLARRVLVLLATIPLSSRTIVVQIYPLLAAGCEVESEEDRQWVRNRWEAMRSRMMIGNVDRCIDVVHEVWARRDEYTRGVLTGEHGVSFAIPTHSRPPLGMDDFDEFPTECPTMRGFQRDYVDVSATSMNAGPEGIPYPYSVHGSLHWAGVMRDWGWEVLLG